MYPPRVPVIDDDPGVSALLTRHFRERGCLVVVASSGRRVSDSPSPTCLADPPDIAVVGVMLPGIDGRDVLRSLRANERTKGCPLVVSSVLDPQDLVGLGDGVPARPFRQSAVARLLDSYRSSVAQESQEDQWLVS